MYRKYRIVESIESSVSQYKSYRDQVYRYTPIRSGRSVGIELRFENNGKHFTKFQVTPSC